MINTAGSTGDDVTKQARSFDMFYVVPRIGLFTDNFDFYFVCRAGQRVSIERSEDGNHPVGGGARANKVQNIHLI